MEIFSSDKMLNYKFGGYKNQAGNYVLINGDFLTSYCNENQTYLICRHDNKQIDGTEKTGDYELKDDKFVPIVYETLEEKLVNLIMNYTGRQQDEIPFLEFSYEIKEDDHVIIIYPHYLDKEPNIQIKMDTDLDSELLNKSLMVRTNKICLGPINDVNKKILSKKISASEKCLKK